MNYIKKQKIIKWFDKHKGAIIGCSSFAILGLVGLLLGFEIQQDWHAIRNWLESPYATTFFICIIIGGLLLVLLIVNVITWKRSADL